MLNVIFWITLLVGLFASGAFLVMHRPKNWFRADAINVSGWVILIFLLYLRSIVTVALYDGGVPQFDSAEQAWFSIITGIVLDALLIYRFKTFMDYRRIQQRRNTYVKG
jgi:hypothetical protein